MKKPMDNKRSPHWSTFRKNFLKGKVCEVCGGKKKLEAHHIMPFHLDRAKELDENNVFALCEGNPAINCHLMIGHLDNFKGFNPDVVADAAALRKKIADNKARIKKGITS